MIAENHVNLYIYSFAENIALSKSAYYVNFDGLITDATVVVDGRKFSNDGKCLSIKGVTRLVIDLGEILSIHHITTYLKDTSGSIVFGIYISIFFSVPFFFLFGTLIFACFNKYCQLCQTENISFLRKVMQA